MVRRFLMASRKGAEGDMALVLVLVLVLVDVLK
jgi:hypothetical protein